MSDIKHDKRMNALLKGKTIDHARYMTEDEAKDQMWSDRPLVIWFTDGSMLMPQRDDEGNDGGAMFYGSQDEQVTIYVLR